MLNKQLSSFVVLDIDCSNERSGRFVLAEAIVARACDFGVNDITYNIRTHLGRILKPGDYYLNHLSAFFLYCTIVETTVLPSSSGFSTELVLRKQ